MTGRLKREDIRLGLLVKVLDGRDEVVTLFHVTGAFVYGSVWQGRKRWKAFSAGLRWRGSIARR
jgi:hypothetical protein